MFRIFFRKAGWREGRRNTRNIATNFETLKKNLRVFSLSLSQRETFSREENEDKWKSCKSYLHIYTKLLYSGKENGS